MSWPPGWSGSRSNSSSSSATASADSPSSRCQRIVSISVPWSPSEFELTLISPSAVGEGEAPVLTRVGFVIQDRTASRKSCVPTSRQSSGSRPRSLHLGLPEGCLHRRQPAIGARGHGIRGRHGRHSARACPPTLIASDAAAGNGSTVKTDLNVHCATHRSLRTAEIDSQRNRSPKCSAVEAALLPLPTDRLRPRTTPPKSTAGTAASMKRSPTRLPGWSP